jgi:acetyl esterase
MNPKQLEKEAQEVVRGTVPPYLFQLGPEKGRQVLDQAQTAAGPVPRPEADIEDRSIPGPQGPVSIRILKPKPPRARLLPVIIYIHGAGWVFGDALTHDRLIRELAVGAQAAVVFPNYSRSPEAKFPTAIEEIYAVALWVSQQGAALGLDVENLAIAGDSVGANMAAAVTLMAKERGKPRLTQQLLFYPVTDASFDTPSYRRFAVGYALHREAMQWFWDQYIKDPEDRRKITASPLRASPEQLRGLPPALVITGEADVLRDEGEAYADKLREAGVRVTSVRFRAIIHDFVMLNALAGTAAARGAIGLAKDWLRKGWITPASEASGTRSLESVGENRAEGRS